MHVHCRTGSLETEAINSRPLTPCSLPYRQLRNMSQTRSFDSLRSLPYRQLRKAPVSPAATFYVVHCRTGSLENPTFGTLSLIWVHCRTGSLESPAEWFVQVEIVHCRTGSLENCSMTPVSASRVHCRTGSLEIADTGKGRLTKVHCRTGSLESEFYRSCQCAAFTAVQAA